MLLVIIYVSYLNDMVVYSTFALVCHPKFNAVSVRYHSGGSMKLNASILHLAYMVYL
jgi:hypothetical protein